ncbi:unnamed protein product [Amaranthus hypochondriacus]
MSILNPQNPTSSDLHVAVFGFPFGTHATPLFNITKKLSSLAPNIIFSFFSTNHSNNRTFSRSNNGEHHQNLFPNIKAYDIWDGLPEGYVFKGNPLEMIEYFMVSAPETLRKAVAVAEEEIGMRVNCMIGDAFLWFVVEMAREKGVNWVPIFMSQEHSLSCHVYTDLIREKIGIQDIAERKKDEVLEFIPGMSKIRIGDLPEGVVVGDLESIFSKIVHQMGRVLPRATAVCVSSCDEFESETLKDLKSKLPNLLCVGPPSLIMPPSNTTTSDQNICLAWLDKQLETDSVVAYVSFGSVVTPNPAEIAALAHGLEASGVSFLWSLKDNLKDHLPQGFIENNKQKGKGMIVAWAPQTQVLAHNAVGVFITHFGCNSIMESIAAGVPMIGRPFIGEQKLNGRLVEAMWEIGLEVEGGVFTKDAIIKGLDQILKGHQALKMKQNIAALKTLLEKAISPQGSCNHNFNKLLDVVTK